MKPAMRLFALMLALLAVPLAAARADDPRAAGGMLAWPQEEMARALGIFVPDRMKAFDVPGVAVAIIDKGEIVYTGTFGKADKSGQRPVTPDTLFQAGELGQAVVALAALSLVDDKLMFLDAPLSRDLEAPWLTDHKDNERVTLRQVLMQTSGLGNNVAHPSRRTGFEPGSRFARSAIGYVYLQYVMEKLTGRSLDEIVASRVFEPLGLTHSHFLLTPETRALEAQAYVPLSFLLVIFYGPFMAALIGLLIVFWAMSRFFFQRRLEPLDYLWPVLGGMVFAMTIVWWGFGLASAVFIIGVAFICAAVVAMLAGFAYYLLYIVGLARARDGIITRGGAGGEWIIVVLAGAIALGGFSPALKWSIPVAQLESLRGVPVANAAVSFRTTAPDMAQLMKALMGEAPLSRIIRGKLYADPVPAGGPFYWSLVSGMRRDGPRETYWMRGSVLGSESLMVMDPARRSGVVILTNARSGGELAQDIARNVLGMEAVWSLP